MNIKNKKCIIGIIIIILFITFTSINSKTPNTTLEGSWLAYDGFGKDLIIKDKTIIFSSGKEHKYRVEDDKLFIRISEFDRIISFKIHGNTMDYTNTHNNESTKYIKKDTFKNNPKVYKKLIGQWGLGKEPFMMITEDHKIIYDPRYERSYTIEAQEDVIIWYKGDNKNNAFYLPFKLDKDTLTIIDGHADLSYNRIK
ncbi:MAG: hypothetical protein N4A76_04100 [Firmicutes bacterium]|jgi:hypothetical protein|nr:hypothetical protein [Bacillota bacterium]